MIIVPDNGQGLFTAHAPNIRSRVDVESDSLNGGGKGSTALRPLVGSKHLGTHLNPGAQKCGDSINKQTNCSPRDQIKEPTYKGPSTVLTRKRKDISPPESSRDTKRLGLSSIHGKQVDEGMIVKPTQPPPKGEGNSLRHGERDDSPPRQESLQDQGRDGSPNHGPYRVDKQITEYGKTSQNQNSCGSSTNNHPQSPLAGNKIIRSASPLGPKREDRSAAPQYQIPGDTRSVDRHVQHRTSQIIRPSTISAQGTPPAGERGDGSRTRVHVDRDVRKPSPVYWTGRHDYLDDRYRQYSRDTQPLTKTVQAYLATMQRERESLEPSLADREGRGLGAEHQIGRHDGRRDDADIAYSQSSQNTTPSTVSNIRRSASRTSRETSPYREYMHPARRELLSQHQAVENKVSLLKHYLERQPHQSNEHSRSPSPNECSATEATSREKFKQDDKRREKSRSLFPRGTLGRNDPRNAAMKEARHVYLGSQPTTATLDQNRRPASPALKILLKSGHSVGSSPINSSARETNKARELSLETNPTTTTNTQEQPSNSPSLRNLPTSSHNQHLSPLNTMTSKAKKAPARELFPNHLQRRLEKEANSSGASNGDMENKKPSEWGHRKVELPGVRGREVWGGDGMLKTVDATSSNKLQPPLQPSPPQSAAHNPPPHSTNRPPSSPALNPSRTCWHCKTTFSSHNKLQHHLRGMCPKTCRHCNGVFQGMNSLRGHLKLECRWTGVGR